MSAKKQNRIKTNKPDIKTLRVILRQEGKEYRSKMFTLYEVDFDETLDKILKAVNLK